MQDTPVMEAKKPLPLPEEAFEIKVIIFFKLYSVSLEYDKHYWLFLYFKNVLWT